MMWNSITSYLTNFSTDHPEETLSDSDDSDWVFISLSGEEVSRKDAFEEKCVEKNNAEDKRKSRSVTVSPTPYGNAKTKLCTPQISPAISPSRMDGSWFVTPPPCFTVKCPSEIEKSPLEDLLIEHPSMSVYCGYQSQFSSRPDGTGKHFFVPRLQDQFSLPLQVTSTVTKERSYGPHVLDHRLPCIILTEHGHQLIKKHEQPSQANDSSAKKVNFSNKSVVKVLSSLENCPIVAHHGKLRGRFPEKQNTSVPKKQLLSKKGKKMEKPSNLVKWSNEWGNLRSSYITRQNRVRQIRNPLRKRNSHVVKPFGEKCKHHI